MKTKTLVTLVGGMLLAATPANGQSDAQVRERETMLKSFFEAKTIVLKIDMPGTSNGVDLTPGETYDVNRHIYRTRVDGYGVALRAGQSAIITKIKLKDNLLEFQLNGGGFQGSIGSSDYVAPVPKTEREKNLEKELDKTADDRQRRAIKKEIADLKRQREYVDTIKRSEAKERAEKERERDLIQAASSGSRFNLRFKKGTPLETFTTEWVIRSLAEYVDFGDLAADRQKPAVFQEAKAAPREQAASREKPATSRLAPEVSPTPSEAPREQAVDRKEPSPSRTANEAPRTTAAVRDLGGLRKGMTREEVDELLGNPKTERSGQEGRLATVTCTYLPGRSQAVEALFVEGVLVRYTISSR